MKKFLTGLFVVMGVIFTILIIIGVCLYITDPWNIRPMIEGISATEAPRTTMTTTLPVDVSATESSSFTLSDAQKQALVSFGIDPASVPSTISAEMEACFVRALGAPRVVEIKAGAVPGALEFFKAKSCI